MEVSSACALINNVIYKPEWEFSAEPFLSRFEGTVRVCVTYPAHKSERAEAPDNYPNEIVGGAKANFLITVADCDDEVSLWRRFITEVLLKIEEHECREFLRVAPSFWAPFHPHRIDGMRRWGAVQADLHFGMA